jgi:hypothetical protein
VAVLLHVEQRIHGNQSKVGVYIQEITGVSLWRAGFSGKNQFWHLGSILVDTQTLEQFMPKSLSSALCHSRNCSGEFC